MRFLKYFILTVVIAFASVITYANIRYVSKSETCDVHWAIFETETVIDSLKMQSIETELRLNPNITASTIKHQLTNSTLTVMYCFQKAESKDFLPVFTNNNVKAKLLTIEDVTGKADIGGPSKCPIMNANNTMVAFVNVFDFRN